MAAVVGASAFFGSVVAGRQHAAAAGGRFEERFAGGEEGVRECTQFTPPPPISKKIYGISALAPALSGRPMDFRERTQKNIPDRV